MEWEGVERMYFLLKRSHEPTNATTTASDHYYFVLDVEKRRNIHCLFWWRELAKKKEEESKCEHFLSTPHFIGGVSNSAIQAESWVFWRTKIKLAMTLYAIRDHSSTIRQLFASRIERYRLWEETWKKLGLLRVKKFELLRNHSWSSWEYHLFSFNAWSIKHWSTQRFSLNSYHPQMTDREWGTLYRTC